MSFGFNGLFMENFSYCVYGNIVKIDLDDWDINVGYEFNCIGKQVGIFFVGCEGVCNKDIDGLFSWCLMFEQIFEFEVGFSCQGNIYIGDMQNINSNNYVKQMFGYEINCMYCEIYLVIYCGEWDFGSLLVYLQYEKICNSWINEGLVGGIEGIFDFNNVGFYIVILCDLIVYGEVNLLLYLGYEQILIFGSEWIEQKFDDFSFNIQNIEEGGLIFGFVGKNCSSSFLVWIFLLFVEDNIELMFGIMFILGLCWDYYDIVGDNWSLLLNLFYVFIEWVILKVGIVCVYKVFNLYQLNFDYLFYSCGQGCYG